MKQVRLGLIAAALLATVAAFASRTDDPQPCGTTDPEQIQLSCPESENQCCIYEGDNEIEVNGLLYRKNDVVLGGFTE